MSGAQPRRSPTERHARRIAVAIAKDLPPPLTPELDLYFENCPREIFAAFEGAARHMPPAGNDANLSFAYLFLLEALLERSRYRTDRGDADAALLIADFQGEIAAQLQTGRIDHEMLAYVGRALHQAKIPVSAELAAASAAQLAADAEDPPGPDDLGAAVGGLLTACGGNPFAFASSLAEFCHALPAEARGALVAGLALYDDPEARAAVVLFLLDADRGVRHAAAGALEEIASSLSPADVRRLIAMRNWRPESERPEIDAIIRKARTAGVDCAQWPAAKVEALSATAIDGTEAQGFLLVSPAGRKKRLSSILIKNGIADAWSGEPESARRIGATIAGAEMPMLAVSRAYLDRVVSDALAVTADKGEVPPAGLLQVAETIGGGDWQPVRIEFSETLAELLAGLPAEMQSASAVDVVLRQSGEIEGLDLVEESWFEDDPQVAQRVVGARSAKPAKLATYLLQTAMAARRGKWANLFLRTALLMCEAPCELDLGWRELAIVAKALADGRDMTEIGLMHEIALRTIAVLRDAEPF
jgi:hypothetical protein